MATRYDSLTMKAIYDAYAPRLKDGSVDPRTLYVGPFIDGIVDYVGEFMEIAFPGSPVSSRRQQMKKVLADVGATADRASHYVIRELQLNMTRKDWATKGQAAPTVMLNDRVRDEEPGELINSPVLVRDPETGETGVMSRVKDSEHEYVPFVPKIREDKRYGLHYMLTGDQVEFVFKTRRGQLMVLRFVLKPLSGGSSLVTPETQLDARRW